MRTLALLLVLCPTLSYGVYGLDRLSALSMIESGDNDRMVGRAGEISRYQILKREWRSVTNSTRFTDRRVAEAVTRQLIERRVANFRQVFQRDPNDYEFYGLWNAPAQVYQRRVSPVVAERCRRYVNLCRLEKPAERAPVALTPPPQVAQAATQKAPAARRAAPTVTFAAASSPGVWLAGGGVR